MERKCGWLCSLPTYTTECWGFESLQQCIQMFHLSADCGKFWKSQMMLDKGDKLYLCFIWIWYFSRPPFDSMCLMSSCTLGHLKSPQKLPFVTVTYLHVIKCILSTFGLFIRHIGLFRGQTKYCWTDEQ
jgi:hypothetical protein